MRPSPVCDPEATRYQQHAEDDGKSNAPAPAIVRLNTPSTNAWGAEEQYQRVQAHAWLEERQKAENDGGRTSEREQPPALDRASAMLDAALLQPLLCPWPSGTANLGDGWDAGSVGSWFILRFAD